MKLVYVMWGYSHDTSISQAFEEIGVTVEFLSLLQEDNGSRKEVLRERIRSAAPDAVFTVNFLAEISDLCEREEIPYCCWVLRLPNFDLYGPAVKNRCNRIGICDSYLVEKLLQTGIRGVFFLPDAVEIGGLREAGFTEREVCFVARYPEVSLSAERMTAYGKGYLDAFLHAQRVLYGAFVLEDGLVSRVWREFEKANPVPEGILPKMRRLYTVDRHFAPACTRLQQDIFLQNFASIMTVYSNGDFPGCNCIKRPFVEEEEKRRVIYGEKEFTLILPDRALHSGMPREVLEVIAAGGFPVVGLQRDLAYFFKRDETLAWFTNPSEFSRAVVHYGNDSGERERVRRAAFDTVRCGHTYRHRIAVMLEMWEKM